MLRLERNTVFVLGAGFTKAFLPDAPLLVDNFGAEEIADKISNINHAKQVLEREINNRPVGLIDLERLMTRLHGGMPYDYEHGATEELALLLVEIKNAFSRRINQAREGSFMEAELNAFSELCIEENIDCITFNYDDVFDESLYDVHSLTRVPPDSVSYWHPDGGYGFFCRPAELSVSDTLVTMDRTAMLLLKLHGSINWRPLRGYKAPYSVNAIVHYENWLPAELEIDSSEIVLHLDREPFIVPPVLTKEALVSQPILRLVWSRAAEVLKAADLVVFIGYSFPVTDIASTFLFGESLKVNCRIKVINFAESNSRESEIRLNYRRVFPKLRYDQFYFDGALEWCSGLASKYGYLKD